MKPQQVAVLFLAVCVVCCAAHRDPTYGDDYENNKLYKDGKPGYKYNGGKQYKPKEYDSEEYKGKQYKPKEYDSEEYKGKQYKPKEYDSEEYNGKQYKGGKPEYKDKEYNGKKYDGKKYEGKEDYYEGKEDYYKGGKDEYYGQEGYYGEEKYGYDDYEKYNYNYEKHHPEKPNKEDYYGPSPYNPKAYDNYEYDRIKAEYPPGEYPEQEYPEENYGYDGYDGGYDGYYGDLPCDNPHKWPSTWAQYKCLDITTGETQPLNTSACKPTATTFCLPWPGKNKQCVWKYSPAMKLCDKAKLPCDADDYCTGSSALCTDNKQPGGNSVLCRQSRGPCEYDQYCDGSKKTCEPSWVPAKTECNGGRNYGKRPLAGICDAPDVCDGKSFQCPDTKFGPGSLAGEKKCKDKDSKLPCDLDDFCDGKADTCPENVKDKGTPCNSKISTDPTKNKPCITGGRCTGSKTDKTCPPLKHVATGTPCNKDGLWTEAYDVEGNVAVKSKTTKEHADMHGWVECDRCYEGECQHFKWEYWNADGDGDHKSSSSPKSSGSHSSSSKKSGHKSSSYKSHKAEIASVNEGEDADDEVLPADGFYPTKIFQTLGVPDPTKASIQSGDYGYGEGHEGHHKAIAAYEPELYCHNPFVTKDYTR